MSRVVCRYFASRLTCAHHSYAGAFNTLEKEEQRPYLDKLRDGVWYVYFEAVQTVCSLCEPDAISREQETIGTLAWFKPFRAILPKSSGVGRLYALSSSLLSKRKAGGSMTKDLFYYLVRTHPGPLILSHSSVYWSRYSWMRTAPVAMSRSRM